MLLVLLALALRMQAVVLPDMDQDERVYVEAASSYARVMRRSDPAAVSSLSSITENGEHPALVKVVYGAAIALLGHEPPLVWRLAACRLVSLAAGLGTVALLAWWEPWAGLALALHSLHAKYSSEAYLEALPGLLALAAFLLWLHAAQGRENRKGALAGSAIALGACAAGKYSHALVALPMGAFILRDFMRGRASGRMLLACAALALAAFWALDPYLWSTPVARLVESLSFHPHYYTAEIQGTINDHPWYQPIVTMATSPAREWHPQALFLPTDGVILLLGLVGLTLPWLGGLRPFRCRSAGRTAAAIGSWFLVGLLFQVAWPTRWPHYTMLTVTPLCMGVGLLARRLHLPWSRRIQGTGPVESSSQRASNQPASRWYNRSCCREM